MFAPPPVKETRVFAQLPAELDLSASKRRSAWLENRPVHGAAVSAFLEGPAFSPAGVLHCVDIAYGRILRIDGDGRFSVAVEYDGAPNGMQFHADGRCFVTDHKRGLLAGRPEDGALTTVLADAFGEGFRGLNDIAFAHNGDIYFTDQGQSGLQDPCGRLFRLDRFGKLELLLSNIPSPNGLTLNRAENAVFVSVTRANQIWKVPFGRGGHIAKVGVFLNLSGGGGPDGVAMDQDDNLYVAAPILGCVWVFSPAGEPLWRIQSCVKGRMTTALAFGGPERKTLFITEAATSAILIAEVDTPGAKLFGDG